MIVSRTVPLCSEQGESVSCSLEVRRLLTGGIAFRVIESGQRAGIGPPVGTTLAAVAWALAEKSVLRLHASSGYYSLQRVDDWIVVDHRDNDASDAQVWKVRMPAFLEALRTVAGRAA